MYTNNVNNVTAVTRRYKLYKDQPHLNNFNHRSIYGMPDSHICTTSRNLANDYKVRSWNYSIFKILTMEALLWSLLPSLPGTFYLIRPTMPLPHSKRFFPLWSSPVLLTFTTILSIFIYIQLTNVKSYIKPSPRFFPAYLLLEKGQNILQTQATELPGTSYCLVILWLISV